MLKIRVSWEGTGPAQYLILGVGMDGCLEKQRLTIVNRVVGDPSPRPWSSYSGCVTGYILSEARYMMREALCGGAQVCDQRQWVSGSAS